MRDHLQPSEDLAPAAATPEPATEPTPGPATPATVDSLLGPSEFAGGATTGLGDLWKRRGLALGDPDGGYFVASQQRQGAKWSTADAAFTGTADKSGLDATYQLDAADALKGKAGKGGGSLAWEHDGKTEGELYLGKGEAGLRRSDVIGDGQLTYGVRRQDIAGQPGENVFGDYRSSDGKLTGEAALGLRGGHAYEAAKLGSTPSPGNSISGELVYDDRGLTTSASGSHALGGGASLSGSASYHHGPDGTTTGLHIGATDPLSPQQQVSGHVDYTTSPKGNEATAGLSERHRTSNLVHGLDLDAGVGTRDYLEATGSADAKLGSNLYGGVWGSFEADRGKQASGQLGASLTLTPSEKTALTLAGVVDQGGNFDARLQLDVLKSRLASATDIADHRKDALLGLFVQYSHGTNPHMLDDRYGGGTAETGIGGPRGDQVTAGIQIKF